MGRNWHWLSFCLGSLSSWAVDFLSVWLTFYMWKSFFTRYLRWNYYRLYRLWVWIPCSVLRANVDDKTSSWSGFWRYIKIASLHLISRRLLLNSVLEKKLAVTLKTLLILEAIAKVVFIVEANLIEKGKSPRPHSLNFKHIHCYFQWQWVVWLQTTHCAWPSVAHLPPYTTRIGMILQVTFRKDERLTVPQVYANRVWRLASNPSSVQGSRVLEP